MVITLPTPSLSSTNIGQNQGPLGQIIETGLPWDRSSRGLCPSEEEGRGGLGEPLSGSACLGKGVMKWAGDEAGDQ